MTGTNTEQETKPIIETVEELLAHAIILEEEAVERYGELAESLDAHNNPEVAGVMRQLAGYGSKHAAEMKRRAEGLTLPHIAPWDFKWPGKESPETAALDGTHYLMTPYHALLLAHAAEVGAHDFYALAAETSSNQEVRTLAAEFAEEEAEHVALLGDWMKKYPKPESGWDFDPDPPAVIE